MDVSDTTQAPTGTTKKMTVANLFTSPTMTTVTVSSGGLTVSAGTTAVQALTVAALAALNNATNTIGSGTGTQRLDLVGAGSTNYDLGVTGSAAILRFGRFSTGSGGYLWEDTSVSALDAMSLNLGGDLSLKLKSAMTGGIVVEAGPIKVANGRADFRNNPTVSVGASATTILASASSNGSLACVNGTDGTNQFVDFVVFGGSTAYKLGAPASGTATAEITVAGTPVTRAYTCVAGNLKLAMSSGTYSVSASEIRMGNTGA